MPDREKVIEGLETIKQFFGYGLPSTAEMFDSYYGILNDTLAMLKEQEETINELQNAYGYLQKQFFEAQDKLLKEQEAKEGHWIVLEFCANEGIYCSECHMKIFDRITKPKKKLSQYCPHCGSRNEQFFRDDEVVFR